LGPPGEAVEHSSKLLLYPWNVQLFSRFGFRKGKESIPIVDATIESFLPDDSSNGC
jgi:hypothetical protein